jgi:hypothetical protein
MNLSKVIMDPPAHELLKEAGQALLNRQMSRLVPPSGADCSARARSQSLSPRRPPHGSSAGFEAVWSKGFASFGPGPSHQVPQEAERRDDSAPSPSPSTYMAQLSERHCSRVLQSMGQSVHILNLHGRIIYW